MTAELERRWNEGELYMETKEYINSDVGHKKTVVLEMQNILNRIKYTKKGWV